MNSKRIYILFIFLFLCALNNSFAQNDKQFLGNSAVPIFKNGEAQIVADFKESKSWIKHELWVETSFDTDGDGKLDRMHVFVTRPYQTDSAGLKLPVVYISSPYFSGVAGNKKEYFWEVNHELGETPKPHVQPIVERKDKRPLIAFFHDRTWVPRGYAVVYSSSPGTGFSDGSPTIGGENERLAPKAVIEWLCGKENGYSSRTGNEKIDAYWSTGKVGMTGTSYNGTLALAAATTGVKGLEAIIPIAPNSSYYHYYRSNGLVRSPGGYLGEDVDVLYDFIHSGDIEKRAYSDSVYRNNIIAKNIDRVTGDYNEFWASRDYLLQMDSMKAPMLVSHGFNDWNVMPEHSLRIYERAKELGIPAQIFYHQKGHGGPPPMRIMNRWFTHYIHGIDNGVENDPKAWIVRENDKRTHPTPYKDFPNPDAEELTFYLVAGNPDMGKLQVEKGSKQGVETLIDDVSIKGKKLAKAKKSDHRLLYLTPILKEDLHISGVPKVTIKLSSNKPAANLSVWLVSLPWKGFRSKTTDNIITRGWADPQNYKSISEGEPLVPDKFYEVSFNLMPDDQVISAGQQIGLMIFSSDKEFTLHPKLGTELSIDLDGTFLILPVVGGEESIKKAINTALIH
ncbi:MAG: Xaa-Pro dipeptidyl-peptidase [Salinivirgaceae bacterium]|nr:Xaa-Pro dipeptidyl-peptidase [Salinivirgaceae bacterium]